MTAKTPSERVTKSRQRALEAGAERVEVILRDADAIAALARLVREHGNKAAAITAALKNVDSR